MICTNHVTDVMTLKEAWMLNNGRLGNGCFGLVPNQNVLVKERILATKWDKKLRGFVKVSLFTNVSDILSRYERGSVEHGLVLLPIMTDFSMLFSNLKNNKMKKVFRGTAQRINQECNIFLLRCYISAAKFWYMLTTKILSFKLDASFLKIG